MTEVLRFALLGLAIGALYAMAAQGMVLIYRASGVVNFAQGAFVMVGGYTYFELDTKHGWSPIPALVGTVVIGLALGVVVYYVIMRPMRSASPIARVVATLAVLQVIQAVAVLRYGQDVNTVKSIFPTTSIHIGSTVIGEDRIVLFGVGLAVTIILWLIYKYSRFGQVTTAVAESERAAASMGHSPDKIAAINWAAGAAIATVTGALIAPITLLQSTQTSQVVMPVLAAALLGGFGSFPLAFVAALAVGVAESVMTYEAAVRDWWPGWAQSNPFLLIIVYLTMRGRGVPLRSYIFDRLPRVGTGHIRPIATAVLTVVGVALVAALPNEWSVALTVTLAFAIVCLSVLVVTGYAGQLSLSQYVVGAMGAFIGARLMRIHAVPFELAFVLGVLAAMAIGLVAGAPALRTRGINLAAVTLGIGVALYALFLTNPGLVGSVDGLAVSPPRFFGLDLDPSVHPKRYGIAVLVILLLLVLMVANLRRGAAGRRLLAVRSNERASLALGISVYTAKLYAFTLAAGIAAVGVELLAYLNSRVVFSQFDIMTSISFVLAAVVGGLGMLVGPLLGSTLVNGGITSRFLSGLDGTLSTYLPLIGGVAVLLVLRSGGDGIFEQNRAFGMAVMRRLRAGRPGHGVREEARERSSAGRTLQTGTSSRTTRSRSEAGGSARLVTVAPRRRDLEARHVTVRFGGVTAVNDMSISVAAGTVHGLIGPNGAGKTTLIDALTGFVRATGHIAVDGIEIGGLSARRRATFGLARSFQSGELFNDMIVGENLAVGSDTMRFRRYAADLVWPGRTPLSVAARAAAEEFGLADAMDMMPEELSFGRRRLIGIARAVASTPSILLLDEPASGLDTDEARELAKLIRLMADEWGIGILLVEHNVDMVIQVCDHVTVMAAGESLVNAAPPAEVRVNPEVVAAYVGDAEGESAAAVGL